VEEMEREGACVRARAREATMWRRPCMAAAAAAAAAVLPRLVGTTRWNCLVGSADVEERT
jgi:hypothetical protein